eukprot:GHVO01053563.1.p1 GENE.GHVO01053563.1~~GHVO01053563.1.p1  ORF type:complete len:465 (+),score=35.39 GHVO01053563.1:112-1506(+)
MPTNNRSEIDPAHIVQGTRRAPAPRLPQVPQRPTIQRPLRSTGPNPRITTPRGSTSRLSTPALTRPARFPEEHPSDPPTTTKTPLNNNLPTTPPGIEHTSPISFDTPLPHSPTSPEKVEEPASKPLIPSQPVIISDSPRDRTYSDLPNKTSLNSNMYNPPSSGTNKIPLSNQQLPPDTPLMATTATGSSLTHSAAARARIYPTENPLPIGSMQSFRFSQWIQNYEEDYEDYQLLYPGHEEIYTSTAKLLLPKTIKQILRQQHKYVEITTPKIFFSILSTAFGVIPTAGPNYVTLYRELWEWEFRQNFRKFLSGFHERYEPLKNDISELGALQIMISKLPQAWTKLISKCRTFGEVWEVYLNHHEAQVLRQKFPDDFKPKYARRASEDKSHYPRRTSDDKERKPFHRRASTDSNRSHYRRDHRKPQSHAIDEYPTIEDEDYTEEDKEDEFTEQEEERIRRNNNHK